MSSTALPRNAALRRNITADSITSSASATPNDSPFDSPRQSPSSTSLSSLSSQEAIAPTKQKLVDSYGNDFVIPDFTIKQLRDAIPAHCFDRSGATGLYYVARDIVLLAGTFYLFNHFVTPETVASRPARIALWAAYTFLQGLFGTGLWVLAHECGHQSFSPSKTLNDTVGWICHSALLVPYFSWKISHGKHHKSTGHIERDMVFLPLKREDYASRAGKLTHELGELMEETPIATLYNLIYQQLGGWPAYLITNVTGHNFHQRQSEGKGAGKKNGFGGGVNHFDPASPLYEKKDEHLIVLSDIGIAITLSILAVLSYKFGFSNVFVWYFIPYLWVNHWLGKPLWSLPPTTPWLTSKQLPSPTSSIPILRSHTTSRPSGPSLVVQLRPLIATSGLSDLISSTELLRPTFFTTTSVPFPSTTPTRQQKPSKPSWAATIAATQKEVLLVLSGVYGGVRGAANGSRRPKVPRAVVCFGSATGTAWARSRLVKHPPIELPHLTAPLNH